MSTSISGSTGVTYPSGGVAAQPGLGDSQSYQNLTASRAAGTTYTNSTDKPIFVMVSMKSSSVSQYIQATVAGVLIGQSQAANNSADVCISFVVPVGATYSVTMGGSVTLDYWFELR